MNNAHAVAIAVDKALDLLGAGLNGMDPEKAHILADRYLLGFLREIGYEEIAAAFEAADSRFGFRYS